MKDFNIIRETFFFAYNFEDDFSTLKLLFACDDDSQISVALTEVIHFEFSRSYKDGGPGYLVYDINYESDLSKIISYLDGKYGFTKKDKSLALVENIDYRLLSIEGDVVLKIVFEDFDIAKITPL